MTEQAAQDPNMPEIDPVEQAEPTELEGQAEPATAEVEETEIGFVETDNEAVQKRINKITAEKYAEKRRADELERKLNEIKPVQPNQPSAEPKLEDFDYDEQAYTVAMIDYKVNQKAAELQKAQEQQVQQQKQAERQQTFNERVANLKKTVTDYEQVVGNIPQLPEQTLNAVMQSEKGPELAYYLGKHLDIADEIATSDPLVAAMRLGQISAQLTAKPQTVKTSAAPEPIEPIGSAGVSNKALEDMSMEEIYNM